MLIYLTLYLIVGIALTEAAKAVENRHTARRIGASAYIGGALLWPVVLAMMVRRLLAK